MSLVRPPILDAWHMYAPVSAYSMLCTFNSVPLPIMSYFLIKSNRKGSSFFNHSTYKVNRARLKSTLKKFDYRTLEVLKNLKVQRQKSNAERFS